jgi:hypothetical protein
MKRKRFYNLWIFIPLFLMSCSSNRLVTSRVAYQSIRTAEPKSSENLDGAKISVSYVIDEKGGLNIYVHNLTPEIMIINQEMSFFVNSNGESNCFYDPTIQTTSTTDLSSTTTGGSVNLGAIGGALGIGGTLGKILGGVNVGGSGTSGEAVTETTYFQDVPRISLGPKGSGRMKRFLISGVGLREIPNVTNPSVTKAMTENTSNCKFSVCISYSVDDGATFNKLVTNFYVNSCFSVDVVEYGKVNDALRTLLKAKSDALNEPWWIMQFNHNITESYSVFDHIKPFGFFLDYQ